MALEMKIPALESQLEASGTKAFKLYGGKLTLYFKEYPKHEYWIIDESGLRVDLFSVTTILDKALDKSDALMGWQGKVHADYLRGVLPSALLGLPTSQNAVDVKTEEIIAGMKKAPYALKSEAGDIGKEAHAWFEEAGKWCIKHKLNMSTASFDLPLPTDPKVLSCVQSGLDWMKQHYVTPLELERKVYSYEDNTPGTLDWIGLVDGKLTLLDFKSSKGLYPNFRFQTAFYKKAYEEETGKHIDQRILLRLGKDTPEFEVHVLDDEDEYWDDYFAFKGANLIFQRLKAIEAKTKKEKKLKREGE